MIRDSAQLKTPYLDALKKYVEDEVVTFDVPGHKKGKIPNDFIEFVGRKTYICDVNVPRGLDNLNNPTGPIKEAQDLCAKAFNVDKAYFVMNGTSMAIQAMIMSCMKAKEVVIMPRNVHKSAIDALVLSGAVPVFITPIIDEEYGFANGVSTYNVIQAIDENPHAKAIYLVYPTYFGSVCDIETIVTYAHKKKMLVLVDEAHGTAYNFSNKLPKSAIEAGADLVASSMHKTGASLTQSSILLSQGNRVDYDRIRTTLNMLHTTSPSSIFLASLDAARKTMYFDGELLIDKMVKLYDFAEKEINKKCKYIHVLTDKYFHKIGVFKHDHTKLVISVKELGLSGKKVYDLLKDEYNVQAELGEMYVVLFSFGIGNIEKDIKALIKALVDIDMKYKTEVKDLEFPVKYEFPKMFVRPREAFHGAKKYVNYLDSEGEISGESIMIYPPGIPLVIPGERINKNTVELIKHYYSIGALVLKSSEGTKVKVLNLVKRNKE